MSVEAFSWALNEAPIPPRERGEPSPSSCLHVLVGLANHADPDGRDAFASVATLMVYTRLSERQVRACLERLEVLGIIVRGNQRIVAERIERADRRPVSWDLQMHLTRPVLAMAPSYARRRYPDHARQEPVDKSPKRGAAAAPRRRNGVQGVQPRGAGPAPKPSRSRPIDHPPTPRGPQHVHLAVGREAAEKTTNGHGPSRAAVDLVLALDYRRGRRPGQRDVMELGGLVDQAVAAGMSWPALTAHCRDVAAAARTSVLGALRAYLQPDSLPIQRTSATVARPPWCRECDETTRQVELEDNRVARCPVCHPLAIGVLTG
jgi:hypothetical protein